MPIDGRNMKSSPRRLERLKRSGAIGTIMDSVKIYGRNSFTGSGHWDFDPQYREQKKRLRRSAVEIINIEIEFVYD